MAIPPGDSLWKAVLGAAILILFIGIGIAHVIDPDRFLQRSGVRKGGQLLTEFNRLGFRIVAFVFAAGAGLMLYILASDVLVR
jgi:hypothetical protein